MKAMTAKDSTKDLEKVGDIEAIWDAAMRFLAERHGIEYIPFPSNGIGYADTAPLIGDLTKDL